MAKLNLSPPWAIYYRQVNALFQYDPEVKVVIDENKYILKLYVEDNPNKVEALTTLLPHEKVFGNVSLQIQIVPSNGNMIEDITRAKNTAELLEDALDRNAAVSYIQHVTGMFNNPITYIVFENEVVQYFVDDLGDAHGVCSTLYQDIAKRIFGERDGIHFCTDFPSNGDIALGTPLGEWP